MNQPQQHVLIIGSVWPEPDSSAAGSRIIQVISLLRQQDWKVSFASPAAKTAHTADLESQGVDTAAIEVNSSSFDTFIQELQPSIVLFDRFIIEEQFGWRVAEYIPETLRILDTEDLHCLRKGRQKAVNKNRSFKKTDLLSSDIAKREIASVLRCDLSLIISEFEIALLENFFEIKPDLLHYLPFLLEPIDEDDIKQWSFEERRDFVMIGNFRHKPNEDAVFWLKNEIWPLIHQRLSDAEIHLYGAYPSSKIKALHNPQNGFFIEGRVENVQKTVQQARVCLAPLRFGAGLKGKLIEAMQYGTPSVTTDIGAEGITNNSYRSGIAVNKPKTIAEAAVELYTDKTLWQQKQKKGAEVINLRFLEREHGSVLIDRILSLQKNLQVHRLNNFTGSMLSHHTAAASKYMAKWIEAKNDG